MANIERELDWDDEIEQDSPEFILLPKGRYHFIVKGFERKRFGGSPKLPPCNQADILVELDGGELGTATVKHSLFLHTKTEGLICAFFTAIGQRKHGQRLKMDWKSVPGSTGWCDVIVESWTGNNGQQRQSNRIQRFLDPEEAGASTTAPAPAPGWSAGKF